MSEKSEKNGAAASPAKKKATPKKGPSDSGGKASASAEKPKSKSKPKAKKKSEPKAKSKQKNSAAAPKKGRIRRILFWSLVAILLFLFCGSVDIEGRTTFEHLDRLIGTDLFQPSHKASIKWLKKARKSIWSTGQDAIDDVKDGAEDLEDRLKDGADDLQKSLKKKAKSIRNKAGSSKHNPVIREMRKSGKSIQRKKELEKPMEELDSADLKAIEDLIPEGSD